MTGIESIPQSGFEVANRDLIEELAELIDEFKSRRGDIFFSQVPREENSEADRLANLAADEV